MDYNELLYLKREQFRQEIRRRQNENEFTKKRQILLNTNESLLDQIKNAFELDDFKKVYSLLPKVNIETQEEANMWVDSELVRKIIELIRVNLEDIKIE